MKTIALTIAAAALTATTAFAGPVLNSNGEQKFDGASLGLAQSQGVYIDREPTASVEVEKDKGYVLNSRGERNYSSSAR